MDCCRNKQSQLIVLMIWYSVHLENKSRDNMLINQIINQWTTKNRNNRKTLSSVFTSLLSLGNCTNLEGGWIQFSFALNLDNSLEHKHRQTIEFKREKKIEETKCVWMIYKITLDDSIILWVGDSFKENPIETGSLVCTRKKVSKKGWWLKLTKKSLLKIDNEKYWNKTMKIWKCHEDLKLCACVKIFCVRFGYKLIFCYFIR